MGKLIIVFFFLPWLACGKQNQHHRVQRQDSTNAAGKSLLNSPEKSSRQTLAKGRVPHRGSTRNSEKSLAAFLLASRSTRVLNRAAVSAPLATMQPSRYPQPLMQSAAKKVKQWAKEESIGPYITLGARKDKVINWYGGIAFGMPALFFGVFWYAAMTIVGAVCDRTGWNSKRSLYDNLGRIWNFCVLRSTGNQPDVITGLENRPKEGQGVLICANHASWYDILLAGYTLPATFKFISAAELAELPGVGKQLYGGKHVLIDRKSRGGQLRAYKEAVDWLSKGVSIFAFPEGTRSRDGKLQRFKGGVFSMALKAGVPILPVTIVDAFQPYPPNALLPIMQSKNMEIHFHPMIETEGRTEDELKTLVRDAIKSKLPANQLPEPKSTEEKTSVLIQN